MAQDEETVSLENLADDALDSFGTKYEEGKSSTSEVSGAAGGEEAPFEGKDSPDESPSIPMTEVEANDQEEEEEEEEEEVLDEFFQMAGSYKGFTMQEKTQQELAEEAQQQEDMWVAYVEELSTSLTRRGNIVLMQPIAVDHAGGKTTESEPLTLFELCEQFENVQTILAENVGTGNGGPGLSANLATVLISLLPQFKSVLLETPFLRVPGKVPLHVSENSGAAAPIEIPGELPSDLVSTSGALKPRCGVLRVKIAAMIAELVRFRTEALDNVLIELGVLQILMDLFFTYDSNNMLHNAVTSSVITILEGSCVPLQRELLENCQLLNRIVKAFEDNEVERAKDKSRQRPYIGALTQISTVVNEVAVSGDRDFIAERVENNPEWKVFVETFLKPLQEIHARQIGGAAPPRANHMEEEHDQGDIWNNLAKILSSFRGNGGGLEGNEGGDFGGLDLASLMALGGFTGVDEDDDDDDDDETEESVPTGLACVNAEKVDFSPGEE